MNVLVVGCGRLGTQLAEWLDHSGHDVSVIDANADNFNRLDEDFDGLTVAGMPMDMSVLRSAGVEGCDAVAVVTPDDNLNITVSQIVREFFGVKNVVARISDPAREEVFTHFGLKTICPTQLASSAMFAALTQPWEERQLTFGTSTVAYNPREIDRQTAGRPIDSLTPRAGEIILGVVHKNGRMTLYDGKQRLILEEGDRVVYTSISD